MNKPTLNKKTYSLCKDLFSGKQKATTTHQTK